MFNPFTNTPVIQLIQRRFVTVSCYRHRRICTLYEIKPTITHGSSIIESLSISRMHA